MRSIVFTGAETLCLRLLLYLLGFLSSVLISRALGPEGRGAYYLPVVAAGVVVTFCKLGLEQSNVFFVGARGYPIERLANLNVLVALVAGSAGVAVLSQASQVLPSVFASTPALLLLLAGLTVPFSLHTQLSAGLLTLQGKVTWQFRVGLLTAVAQATVLVALNAVGWLNVASTLGVTLATAVMSWGLTIWGFRSWGILRIRGDVGLLKETMGHSLVLHLGMVLFFLHLRVDTFMMQAMAGTEALGQYSLSVMLAETVLLASDSLAITLLPRQMDNSMEECAALGLRGARTNLLIGLGLAAAWAAVGLPVITLTYGPAFVPAYFPLLGLLPGVVFQGMQRCAGGPVLRAGTPWRIVSIYAASLVLNVVLNAVLIPEAGALGAAAASSISYGASLLLFMVWTAQLARTGIAEGIVPRRADITSVLGAGRRVARALGWSGGTGGQE